MTDPIHTMQYTRVIHRLTVPVANIVHDRVDFMLGPVWFRTTFVALQNILVGCQRELWHR